MDKINLFVINLVKRSDRKGSIIAEFKDKNEFVMTVIPAIEHEVGSFGLWQTIRQIVQHADHHRLDYVLICEDDHVFTETYSAEFFSDTIVQAKSYNADVLLGGVSWFDQGLQVGKDLFWLDRFTGAQCMVIFSGLYKRILTTEYELGDNADVKISSLTDDIFVTYPFISVQKEFGYSDVTKINGELGRVTALFKTRQEILEKLNTMRSFYQKNFSL